MVLLKNIPKKQRILVAELDTNKTLSGEIKSFMWFVFYKKYLEEVCFWNLFHRVILIKTATEDEESIENHSVKEELYLKSLKKNVIVIRQEEPEIGWTY